MPVLALLALLLSGVGAVAADDNLSLAGEWRFRLDPADAGLDAGWFKHDLPDRISLPGSTDQHRYGRKNDAREPRRFTRAFEYVGAAWYQRDVTIPDQWKGKRLELFLERCHWETQAWLDGRLLGLQNSLSTPHVYDLGDAVRPGPHRLTVRVDNRVKIDVGWWASAVTEEGPGNWNGLVGRLELRAHEPLRIRSVSVYPDAARNTARVNLNVLNSTGEPHEVEVELAAALRGDPRQTYHLRERVKITNRPRTTIALELPLGTSTRRWDEFSPALFDLSARLAGKYAGEIHTTFGIRAWTVAAKELRLNGRTISLRGTVDNGAFPLRGYPPADVETWRRRFQIYQAYGFNHVRFHSWCPPEAAFAAADELGLLLQVENPMWIGDGRVSANALRTAFIRQEAEAIVDLYGNHPSFLLMSMGNELGTGLDLFVGELVTALRARDPRHLYTSTTAPDNLRRPDDFFVSAGPGWQHLRGDPRLARNPPDTAFDYGEYVAALDRPVLAHELGQWTVFPNLTESAKYTGPLQPRYFGIYRESLERNGLLDQAEAFRQASGALMLALYKEEIESVLRTPGLTGFQLLGLADWPGFGPAFVGVLDALCESKGLIQPEAFRRFNGPTVPLLRIRKRIWTTAEELAAGVEVAHYGPDAIEVSPSWTVRDGNASVVVSGQLPPIRVPAGGRTQLGAMRVPLQTLAAPARYSVEIALGTISNSWDVWVYPARLPEMASGFVLAGRWDDAAREALKSGRTVVLFGREMRARTVPMSYTTAFWSLLWFSKRPETMGILCDPSHAALAAFPTASHSDWQWWDLTSHSRAFVLNDAPRGFRPIVQVIDDANRNYRLGAVIEARVGRGRLLAASLDLERALENRPAARQLRHSLLVYAASDQFQPRVELGLEFLDRLFAVND